MSDDRIYICVNCNLEFDLEDSNIKIITRTASRCTILDGDGGSHSLKQMSWEKSRKILALQNVGRSVNDSSLSSLDKEESDL